MLKKALYEALIHPLTYVCCETTTNELVQATVPPLFSGSVDDMKQYMEAGLTHGLTHTIPNSLGLTVGTILPEVLESVLPVHLITELTSAITQGLGRGLTHSVSATLLQVFKHFLAVLSSISPMTVCTWPDHCAICVLIVHSPPAIRRVLLLFLRHGKALL